MAGELGVNYPIGMYDLGLSFHKLIYYTQWERIRCRIRLSNKNVYPVKVYFGL